MRRLVQVLHSINLIFAALALVTPAAHVMEIPNKLALDGRLWLAVQQHLYRGWGPFFGAPVEIGSLLTSLALIAPRRGDHRTLWLTILAAIAYAGMIIVFFIFNNTVNAALSAWTPETLPANWPSYRLRWETGHALAFVLALLALLALIRAYLVDRDRARATSSVRT